MACEQGFTGGGIQVCLFVCSAQNGLKAERDRDVYLFVLALIVIGVVAAVLIGMIKQNRAEIMELKRHIQRLEARFDGITERE